MSCEGVHGAEDARQCRFPGHGEGLGPGWYYTSLNSDRAAMARLRASMGIPHYGILPTLRPALESLHAHGLTTSEQCGQWATPVTIRCMHMLFTTLTLAQINDLEQIFAVLTPNGWVIPDWLIALREAVSLNR